MGLDIYLQYKKQTISINSKKYPNHLFKIGYFRSSYNEGGINNYLRRLGFKDLYELFNYKEQKIPYVKPNWIKVLQNVNQEIQDIKAYFALDKMSKYDVTELSFFNGETFKNSEEALTYFKKEILKNNGSYGSKQGHFFLDNPLSIYAIMYGKNCIGSPCVYVIFERELSDFAFYIEALEIVQETIEYVLSQPDPDKYKLIWSG